MTAIVKTNKKAVAKLKKVAEKLSKEMRPQINAAINETTKRMRTNGSKETRKKLVGSKERVDARFNRRISQVKTLSGRLYISDSTMGIGTFKSTQNKVGVNVKINKQGSRTFFPGYFGPKRERLSPGVYKRTTAKPFPIEQPPPLVFKTETKRYGITEQLRLSSKDILKKEVGRRIRLMELRAAGKVKTTKYSY
jgi:hypothetical protein